MTKERFVQEVEAHQDTLYRVALTILHNDSDVQDALQEAVLRAWEKRHTLRQEAYFTTWLVRILINECRRLHRRQRRMIPVEEVPDTAVSFQGLTLRLLMETLPDKLRLPLALKYAEGMDDREIAAVLRLTPAAVRSRIHRAKKLLRKELEEDA